MSKSGLRAFVYSFSVSLFAIISANRAFWHSTPQISPCTETNGKNIVLFLNPNKTLSSPTKKISLNVLPELKAETSPPPQLQQEIILASSLDEFDFPLEIEAPQEEPVAPQAVLADVLYSPDVPITAPDIDVPAIYTPQQNEEKIIQAPKIKHEVTIAVKENDAEIVPSQPVKSQSSAETEALLAARAAVADNFPLQTSSDTKKDNAKIHIGDPADLNNVALDKSDISIHSMEKDIAPKKTKNWQQMSDTPWLIAKAGGSTKNKMAEKAFEGKSFDDISKSLKTEQTRPEIKVASETTKNLLIPIPSEIMEDKNLTPKLAYPSSSEDAAKEKAINETLKKKEKSAPKTADKTELLSPIEEDIALDAPQTTPIISSTASLSEDKTKDAPEAKSSITTKVTDNSTKKSGLMNTLNSIFSSAQKDIPDAKEKAIAKAQAKRSFKKRFAQSRPVSIMPTEIRLSFQPNRAEISGQTLRWVQAFATKAAELPNIALEIRIDSTGTTGLQQKRLNLLQSILTNKGVEHSKINTVFTTREPNSFILRTVKLENRKQGGNDGKTNNQYDRQYIQW